MSQCRSCDAEIIWAKTLPNGKNIPVDPVPVKGGNIQLELIGGKQRAIIHPSDPEITRHVSHFATCPNAKEHRRDR